MSSPKRSNLKPWDYGIKKLSLRDSKLQKQIWFDQMVKFFEVFDCDEAGQLGTWRDKKLTFIMLVNSIEPEVLEKMFGSKRAEYLKCHDTHKLMDAVHKFIKDKKGCLK